MNTMANSFQSEAHMTEIVSKVLTGMTDHSGYVFQPDAQARIMGKLLAAAPEADAHDTVKNAIMAEVVSTPYDR